MEKALPHNQEAERATLGSILLDRDAIVAVDAWLQPEYFYQERHAWIYEAMQACFRRRVPPDIQTVADELARRDRLASVGGVAYLAELAAQTPTAVHIDFYARIVERTAILRRLIQAGSQIAALGFDERSELEDTLDKAEELLFAVSQRRSTTDFVHIGQVVDAYFDQVTYLQEHRGEVVGVPTGYRDLDKITGGFQRSDLIILAARPSVGKCLKHDTLIDDPRTGERLTIAACVQRQLPVVYGVSERGELRTALVSNWVDSGIQPCFRVRTRTGRMVEVTGNHPFLTVTGWTPLRELRAGTLIAVPRAVPAFGQDDSWTLDQVRLLAYCVAEGSTGDYRPGFASCDPVIVADVRATIARLFAVSAPDEAATSPWPLPRAGATAALPFSSMASWLAELGLARTRAEQWRFPACVWRWSRRLLAEFVRALMSATGTVDTAGHVLSIEWLATSAGLAADLQHALTRFGVVARITPAAFGSYRVEITDSASLARYQAEIGWIGDAPAPAARAAASGDSPPDRGSIVRARLAQATSVLDLDHLRRMTSPDLYWDELAEITPIGAHQVYDLTVPAGSNFIAQDICVHNTSLALCLAYNVAARARGSVGIFSLEMSREQLVQRILGMHTGIDVQKLRTGQFRDSDLQVVMEALGELAELPIYIEDTPGLSVTEVRSRARRLQAEAGVDMLVIDYLQLMSGNRRENRVAEVSEISRSLKGLARELNIPVIALSQLSRAVEGRTSHVPMLSDLRESGCLAGETLVYLPDEGDYRRIDALAGTRGFHVLALNPETWQLERRPVVNAFCTGCRPVVRLTTELGRSIRATANHKFLTNAGWKRLDELTRDDRIALPRTLPGRDVATMSDAELALRAQRDVYWDGIISIKPDGESSVYDLTVAGLHNFVANNIAVHNSIEQDADVVMFIYREELYDKETDKKGIAEIHIAKHRNGPVGMVPLRFEPNTTRFQDLERYLTPEGY